MSDSQNSQSEYSAKYEPVVEHVYNPNECKYCWSTPAKKITFSQQWVGSGYDNLFTFLFDRLIGWPEIRSSEGPYCRSCATATFRDMVDGTCKTGWWGLIAFVSNIAVLLGNFLSWRQIQQLTEPHRNPREAYPDFVRPLAPGDNLVSRGGIWLGVAVILLVAVVLVLLFSVV